MVEFKTKLDKMWRPDNCLLENSQLTGNDDRRNRELRGIISRTG